MLPNDNLHAALDAFDKGYTPIPTQPGLKVPAIKWKPWQTERPTTDIIHEWFQDTRCNVAILCNGFVTVDVDDADLLDFVIDKCGQTPSIRQTPSGGYHLDYRARKGVQVQNIVDVHGKSIDLRAAGGYVLIPPSENEQGVPYRWLGAGLVPVAELPVFKVTWTRSRTRKRVTTTLIDEHELDRNEKRALAYVSCIEGAVSGQGGHRRTMRVAGVLIQMFRLDIESALHIFQIWNEKCEPPWSERDLRHKLESAVKNLSKYT